MKDMYSDVGRPSIDPVFLVKHSIQYIFGIRSMRKTIEEADHLRHHQDVKHIFAIRKETIERVLEMQKKSMVCVGLL
ncbi:hypothetical protein AM233_24020 [Bacillus sp. FJAT-22058]|nr:hypothetical protein AM233_24020 [Bacillus sp. FJAT-22058]